MTDQFLPEGAERPDFYIAAMGRSGSTMLANWLSSPPDQVVLLEPSLLRLPNTRLLRIQLENLGLGPDDGEWSFKDESASARFARLLAPRLAGRRWALKEVLCSEHASVMRLLQPDRVLISVRHIFDVALSFFEKHRLQDNLSRFSDAWVTEYCVREAAGLVSLRAELAKHSIPFQIVRYEDFTRSEVVRHQVADFVGWRGGGATDAHFQTFDRGFEVERHGSGISPRIRQAEERTVDAELRKLARAVMGRCAEYQVTFGYGLDDRARETSGAPITTQ